MDYGRSGRSSSIKSVLRPGEELLWSGAPRRITFARHRGSVGFLLVFGLVFTVAGIGGAVSVLGGNRATESSTGEEIGLAGSLVFALLFPLVGIGVLAFVVHTWRLAARIMYAVTNERVLAVDLRSDGARVVDQWGMESLPHIEVKSGRSGVGSVMIGYRGGHSENRTTKTGLVGVSNPEEVARIIREQRYAPGKPEFWLDAPAAGGKAQHASGAPVHEVRSVPSEVRDVLQEGESVVWLGRPMAGHLLRYQMLPGLLFFGAWYGVLGWAWVIPRITAAMNARESSVAPLNWFDFVFMIPFVIGPLVLIGFEVRRRLRMGRIGHYIVTNRRAMVLDPGASLSAIRLVEYGPMSLDPVKVKDHGSWGHIFFGAPRTRKSNEKQNLIYGFVGVEHPRKVADIIKAQGWAANAVWK